MSPSNERSTKAKLLIASHFFHFIFPRHGLQLIKELETLQDSGDDHAHDCPFLLNILVEAYEEEASEKGIRRALSVLERLVIVDGKRSIYWLRKAKQCEAKLQVRFISCADLV